jgi:hypothetical protein
MQALPRSLMRRPSRWAHAESTRLAEEAPEKEDECSGAFAQSSEYALDGQVRF